MRNARWRSAVTLMLMLSIVGVLAHSTKPVYAASSTSTEEEQDDPGADASWTWTQANVTGLEWGVAGAVAGAAGGAFGVPGIAGGAVVAGGAGYVGGVLAYAVGWAFGCGLGDGSDGIQEVQAYPPDALDLAL